MGFPAWRTVCDWLDEDITVAVPNENPTKGVSLKNPEIPKLDNYKFPANEKFWSSFPKKELPGKAETEVLTDVFEELVLKASTKMTACEFKRAKKVVKDLRNGADAFQKGPLPPVNAVNAQSTFDHGELLTDTIATWVKKGGLWRDRLIAHLCQVSASIHLE